MSGRGNPGDKSRVVSKGHIRVDAAKAMAKLREHLLVDLHDYTLEIVRAAVASNAPRIDIAYDADDITIAWVGRPVDAAALERLLDHVLTEARGDDAQRMRLLALGVNAALGLEPAYVAVDVVAADGSSCTRTLWTPAMVKARTAEALRPGQEAVAVPADLAAGGIRVWIHRTVGWAVLRRAASGGAPTEVTRLSAATHDLRIPITLNGSAWPRPPSPPVLLRMPFGLADESAAPLRHATLEILVPDANGVSVEPHLEWLERGVRLVRYALCPTSFPFQPFEQLTLPVRVCIDADALPTNASRSQLQSDSALYQQAHTAVEEALVQALAALLDVHEGKQAPAGIWLDDNVELRRRVLGVLTCVAVGARRSGAPMSGLVERLLRMPLYRNACGEARAYLELEPAPGELLVVYDGAEALEIELGDHASRVMWPTGSIAERALRGATTVSADRLIDEARRERQLRDRFLAHRAGPVTVPDHPGYVSREAFEVLAATNAGLDEQGVFSGLIGEVAVRQPGDRRPGTVRIFLWGREIAVRSLREDRCPLSLEIALAWDGHFTPRPLYDDVEDTSELAAATWYAIRIGVLQVAELAQRLEDISPAVREPAMQAIRSAVGVVLRGPAAFEVEARFALHGPAFLPLFAARVWPTTQGTHLSIDEIRAEVARFGAYFLGREGASGSTLDGRSVLVVDSAACLWLSWMFPGVPAVFYDRALIRDPKAMHHARWGAVEAAVARALAEQRGLHSLRVRAEQDGVVAAIAPAAESSRITCHAGVLVSRGPHPALFGNVVLAVDNAHLTPNGDWTGVHHVLRQAKVKAIERELLATAIAARAGDEASRDRLGLGPAVAVPALERYLLASIAPLQRQLRADRERPHATENDDLAELYERLASLPLLLGLDANGKPKRVTLRELDEQHPPPGPVPYLREVPDFAPFTWCPLLLDGRVDDALLRWLGARAVDASGELAERRAAAVRAQQRHSFMCGDTLDPWSLGAPGGHHPPVLRYESAGVKVAVALPSRVVPNAQVEVLAWGRKVCHVELGAAPVVARVSLADDAWLVPTLDDLTLDGLVEVAVLVNDAAAELVLHGLRQEVDEGSPAPLLQPAFARLVAVTLTNVSATRRRDIMTAVRRAPVWPKVQGGRTALGLVIAATGTRTVAIGRHHYPDWVRSRRRTHLDRPALWLPTGSVGEDLEKIILALNLEPNDLTQALAIVYARRAAPDENVAPALRGEAPHPALRVTIASLRLTGLEGEIELGHAGPSDVLLTDLDGTRPFEVAVGCPLRAALSVEAPRSPESDEAVTATLRRAVSLSFVNLINKLDELPTIVRSHYRTHLLFKLAAGVDLYERDRRAPVFVDTLGGWHDLQAMSQQREIWVTQLPPPWPTTELGRPIFTLDDGAAQVLAKGLGASVLDRDDMLQRIMAGNLRQAAPPMASMRLPGAIRDRCWRSELVDEPGMRGEVGLLQGNANEHEGIELHVGGRPLQTLSWPGWPTVAVLDVDGEPDMFFEGLADPHGSARIVRRVTAIVEGLIRQHTAPPTDALASHEVAADEAGVAVRGQLWLPAELPEAPMVLIGTVGRGGDGAPVTLRSLPAATKNISRVIPVEGGLLVVGGADQDLHGALAELALGAARQMVASLEAERPPAERQAAIDGYRWNFSLLHEDIAPSVEAETTEGSVGRAGVVAAIERGKVWWTAHDGTTDGQFPGEAPPFILCDRPRHALLRVLRLRASKVLSELGGEISAHGQAPMSGQLRASHTLVMADDEPMSSPRREPVARVEELVVAPSWWDGLTRRVVSVFVDLPPPAPVSSRFLAALEGMLRRVQVPLDVVTGVVFSRSGRAVRYDGEARRLVVNRDHCAVRRLVPPGEEPTDAALKILTAAALSELNRAYVTITAAQEKHALILLMRSE